jgi:hypothetical protein
VLKNEFPRVIFDKCLIVTSRSVYCIEMREKPHVMFLTLAVTSSWGLCDGFCKTFYLNMTECVEFSGDSMLTYNIARIPPIKTVLKLAMFNETALRQIAAMVLKIHLNHQQLFLQLHREQLRSKDKQFSVISLVESPAFDALRAKCQGHAFGEF